jgi:hypothetical protein
VRTVVPEDNPGHFTSRGLWDGSQPTSMPNQRAFPCGVRVTAPVSRTRVSELVQVERGALVISA